MRQSLVAIGLWGRLKFVHVESVLEYFNCLCSDRDNEVPLVTWDFFRVPG